MIFKGFFISLNQPCKCMCKHAFAGWNTQHVQSSYVNNFSLYILKKNITQNWEALQYMSPPCHCNSIPHQQNPALH